MHRCFALRNSPNGCYGGHALVSVWVFLLCSVIAALAQGTAPPSNPTVPFSIRATHVLGLPNTKNNCTGILSIQNDALRFQKCGNPDAQVNLASVRALFLGEESKQVGGVPMKVGKVAAPFGGGRLVSLVAHKNYDTLTLEFVDSDGGVHGAIFEVTQGQGENVRDQLVAQGVSSSSSEDRLTKQSTSEVTHEDK